VTAPSRAPLTQDEQDKIWSHHQTDATGVFDLSYPRLRFLAERCTPGMRVLNIGVGSGYLEKLLVQRGVEVFSLDPSSASIDRLRKELSMGDRAQQGYGQRIPFDTAYFDTVVMTEVLEHLSTDVLDATLEEVRRVLKAGGQLTGTVPYCEDLAANEVLCPRCNAQFHRWGHAQRFDAASLRALLASHGFRVTKAYPRAFPDFRRRNAVLFLKALFRYLLGRLGEPLVGPNLYFTAVTRDDIGDRRPLGHSADTVSVPPSR
jgi:SAM-dependent methyltransferase